MITLTSSKKADERANRFNSRCLLFLPVTCSNSGAPGASIQNPPVFNPDIHVITPSGWDPAHYSDASCFPGDNTTLLLTLATGVFFISRLVGATMFLYVVFVICLPRIYLGLHYPTDILAGGVPGAGVGMIFNSNKVRCNVSKPFMRLLHEQPGLFYAFFPAIFSDGDNFHEYPENRSLSESSVCSCRQ